LVETFSKKGITLLRISASPVIRVRRDLHTIYQGPVKVVALFEVYRSGVIKDLFGVKARRLTVGCQKQGLTGGIFTYKPLGCYATLGVRDNYPRIVAFMRRQARSGRIDVNDL
jgi:hypothetical protein